MQQAMRAIRSNWIASVSTITTMTLSLTILAGFSLLSLNLNRLLGELQNELEVAVYLAPDANAPQLLSTISAWPEVARADLISPEEALASLVDDLDYLEQAAALIPNPLPPTIELRLLDPAQTPFVSERLRRLGGVDGVEDGSDAVDTFVAINDALQIGGSVLIVVLLSSALFAIVNSIRAAITARRGEIEVMRLVGATRTFIRAPFLIEGFLLGLFSAVITAALVVPGYQLIVQRLSEQLPFVPLVSDAALLGRILLLLLALALLVGLVGSAISVAQHLQEDTSL
ncbi:MAG: permease-like cell division protein FtsX [Trueperaceae bacterium]|nr:permease-like cell division protein FtsX [Trueperaceae bacterium]